MALGKNLKKRKLIEEKTEKAKKPTKSTAKKPVEKKPATKKTTEKKLVVKADKELITKPKVKKATKAKTPKKITKPRVSKKATKSKVAIQKEPQSQAIATREERKPQIDAGLPIYIAKELHDLKTSLRNRYKEEVAKLKGSIIQFVIIEIGGEHYAVDIDCVKEVVPASNLSKTPNTPNHIQGIVNVRGATYVVFDLTKKFKIDSNQASNYFMVLEHNNISAAISLQNLPATRKLNGDHITSELHMIENASLDVSYIKGLIRDDQQLIYYLDIIELLKNDKAIVVPDNLTAIN